MFDVFDVITKRSWQAVIKPTTFIGKGDNNWFHLLNEITLRWTALIFWKRQMCFNYKLSLRLPIPKNFRGYACRISADTVAILIVRKMKKIGSGGKDRQPIFTHELAAQKIHC